jgi:hypothetical protein
MWQYQLDEDHFYDLRDLPVGGWSTSSLTCKTDGQWLTFSHPSRKTPINSFRRVNRDLRYIPPITSLNNALSRSVELPSSPPPEFLMTPGTLRAMNLEHSLQNPLPEIEERPVVKLAQTGSLFQRSLRKLDRRPKTSLNQCRSPGLAPLGFAVFEDESLPDQEVAVDRRIGTEKGRQPFRISQIKIRSQIHEVMDWRNERKAVVKRPATTNARVLSLNLGMNM